MIVNAGEILAEEFSAEIYPEGTHLFYSDLEISSMVEGRMSTTRTMAEGTLVGYDALGSVKYVLVQKNDANHIPSGIVKPIPLSALRNFAEIIELPEDTETRDTPVIP